MEPSKAKGILFPTIFTMSPDNIIQCRRCKRVDLVVLILVSLETLKPRIYHSCGVCYGVPEFRMGLVQPDHFKDVLLEITSSLMHDRTPDEIADVFASSFEIVGDGIKSNLV